MANVGRISNVPIGPWTVARRKLRPDGGGSLRVISRSALCPRPTNYHFNWSRGFAGDFSLIFRNHFTDCSSNDSGKTI